MKEERRKEAVRFTGRRARCGSMRLGWKKKKRKYSSFAIHAVYNRSNLDGIERKLDLRVFIIYTWSNVCRDHSVLEFRFEGKDYLFRILVPSPLPLVPKTTKAN